MVFARRLIIHGLKDKEIGFEESITISELKTEILKQTGINPEDCKLIVSGQDLFKIPEYLRMTVQQAEASIGLGLGNGSSGLFYLPETQPAPRNEGAVPNTTTSNSRKLEIKNLKGAAVNCNDSMTIYELKAAILSQIGVDPENFKLMAGGEDVFQDDRFLLMTIQEVEALTKMPFGSGTTGLFYSRLKKTPRNEGVAPNTTTSNTAASPASTPSVPEVKNDSSLSENKTSSPATVTSDKKEESTLGRIGAFSRDLEIKGLGGKAIYVYFNNSTTIDELKAEILSQTGINPEDCILIMAGKDIFDSPEYLRATVQQVEISFKMSFGSSSAGLYYKPETQPAPRNEGAVPNTAASPASTPSVPEVKKGPSLSENKTSSPATVTSAKKESALRKVGTFGTINAAQQTKKKSLLERLFNSSSNDDSSAPTFRGKSK